MEIRLNCKHQIQKERDRKGENKTDRKRRNCNIKNRKKERK
jgi:hypothetical protein